MTATSATAVPPRKVPFWRTVGRAYAMPFANFGALMRVAWPWLLVLAPAVFVILYLMVPLYAEMVAAVDANPEAFSTPWSLRLLTFILQLVTLPAVASIAVAWHRLLLLGEPPAAGFTFNRSVGLYAAFLLAVVVFFALLQALPEAIAAPSAGQMGAWATVSFLTMALTIVGLFVINRWALVLPAIAVGRTDIGLAEAWSATRRNGWRLFWGPIICLIILMLPGFLVSRLTQADRVTTTIGMTLMQLVAVAGGVIGVGFLSFAYQHFFEAEDRAA